MKNYLANGTVIKERYVVDCVITAKIPNQINYSCVDQTNGKKVMIKEFYPSYASRGVDGQLSYMQSHSDDMDKFVFNNNQAVTYGKLPTLLDVYDIFNANNTLYAVCEYTDFKTVETLGKEKYYFSKTTIKNILLMLLKTNMALAKFSICIANFRPENIIITKDGRVKLLEFCPQNLSSYEGESTKSLAGLAYYMATGMDTDSVRKAMRYHVNSGVKPILKYAMYVINNTESVTTLDFYNATLLRFDEKLIFNGGTPEIKSSKSPGGTVKKRFIAIIAVAAVLFAGATTYVGIKATQTLQEETNLEFTTIKYSTVSNGKTTGEFSPESFSKSPDINLLKNDYNAAISDLDKGTEAIDFDITAKKGINIECTDTDGKVIESKKNKYTVPITQGKDGVITFRLYKKVLSLIDISHTYTITYTTKKQLELKNLVLSYDKEGTQKLSNFEFNPDTHSYGNLKLKDTVNKVYITAEPGENGKIVIDGAVGVEGAYELAVPYEGEKAVKVSVVVADESKEKSYITNDYTITFLGGKSAETLEKEAQAKAAKEKAEAEAKAKDAKEKADADAKAKDAKEKADADAKAKDAKEKAEAEAKEKAAKEKAEAEAKEKAAKEKAEAEAKEKVAKEKAEAEAKQRADNEKKAAIQYAEEQRKTADDKQAEADKAKEAYDTALKEGETGNNLRKLNQDYQAKQATATEADKKASEAEKRVNDLSLNNV